MEGWSGNGGRTADAGYGGGEAILAGAVAGRVIAVTRGDGVITARGYVGKDQPEEGKGR